MYQSQGVYHLGNGSIEGNYRKFLLRSCWEISSALEVNADDNLTTLQGLCPQVTYLSVKSRPQFLQFKSLSTLFWIWQINSIFLYVDLYLKFKHFLPCLYNLMCRSSCFLPQFRSCIFSLWGWIQSYNNSISIHSYIYIHVKVT